MLGKLAIGLFVAEVVRDMREVGTLRAEALDFFQRLRYGHVRGMRRVAQRIKKENIHATQQLCRRFRNLVVVGQIGDVTEPKPENLQIAMPNADWEKFEAEQVHGRGHQMSIDQG